MGRVHLGRQDLRELQTRKMKGLKRRRDDGDDGEEMDVDEDVISASDEDIDGGGVKLKRIKMAEV